MACSEAFEGYRSPISSVLNSSRIYTALGGHPNAHSQCPVWEEKRTLIENSPMSACTARLARSWIQHAELL
jgi:hypothetical protein